MLANFLKSQFYAQHPRSINFSIKDKNAWGTLDYYEVGFKMIFIFYLLLFFFVEDIAADVCGVVV